MLTVEKIGGTSMTNFKDVLNNIILRDRFNLYNRILVVSAYGGVTNWLLEHKKTGEAGIYAKFADGEDYEFALEELLSKLKEMNAQYADLGLDLEKANAFIESRIQQTKNYLRSMADVLASGYVEKNNILLAGREILSSVGEAHSAFNSVNICQHNGVDATFVDLCGFNDSKSFSIDERISHEFENIDTAKTLAIATGYTKGTEGIMREFDRGYSEVTFSKIAVHTNAHEAVIHKEFHLSSADPNIVGVENSIPVGQTNYNVADQLADIGMEAIHPKASKPIEVAGINIRIKNTFEPDHPGTLISKDYVGKQSKVEIITGSDKVVAIEVHDPLMVGEVGFDMEIMQIFKNFGISYILKSTNANSITQVIWEKDLNPGLIQTLEAKYSMITIKNVALVSILGTNIAQPGILSRATATISDNSINVEAVAQSLQQVNMQFVIGRQDYEKAILVLNKELCVKN